MSARAIVSGVLFKAPASKVSKGGKPYVTLTIREGSGEAARWWRAVIFGESAIEEALRLGDGEPISVAGDFDAELYSRPDGAPRITWRITVDSVLSAHRKPKAKSEQTNRQPRAAGGRGAASASWAAPTLGGAHASDDIPF